MAHFEIIERDLPGLPSGYTSREKRMTSGFVASLPATPSKPPVEGVRPLAEVITDDFVADDGVGEYRNRKVGKIPFINFRDNTVGKESAPDPDRPTRIMYLARYLGPQLIGEEVDPDSVLALFEVNYVLTEPMTLPSGLVMPAGEKYGLRVVESVTHEITGDGPDDWVVPGRRAVFVDGPIPPFAIEREYRTRLEKGAWPPFPSDAILLHPPDLA